MKVNTLNLQRNIDIQDNGQCWRNPGTPAGHPGCQAGVLLGFGESSNVLNSPGGSCICVWWKLYLRLVGVVFLSGGS